MCLWSLRENFLSTVIPSEARNLALSILNPLRDSSSPPAPRNDMQGKFSHRLFGPPQGMKISVVVPAKAGTHCQSNGFPLSRE